ncbi:hypothetical protein EV421DRAFT_1908996 [Armillaria borealis]|uniref:Mid2 domain-containing protein n=1 Tax=Armillaria borealis TaxID=47425 RepID=A0AA39MIC0_9AGAR|nr:hypothetical protein EV421DRAFT_1908996 [Armillaria borealis]
MSFLFFLLCTIIALIPLVLSLDITLESTPEAFQSTPISLRQDYDDPYDFVLGAFTIDGIVAATANQVVANFTADRNVNMTFNYTSPFGKDCILLAWIPQAEPRNKFAQSEPFSVTDGRPGITGTPEPTVTVLSSMVPGIIPTTSNSISSVSGTTSSLTSPPVSRTGQKAIPTEAVVGAVIGSFVLLSIVSAAAFIILWRRRNRKLKESAPSRAFWRYLDRKGPPISRRPVREPLPVYTAQGRTFERPAVRPPPLRLPDSYYLHGKL